VPMLHTPSWQAITGSCLLVPIEYSTAVSQASSSALLHGCARPTPKVTVPGAAAAQQNTHAALCQCSASAFNAEHLLVELQEHHDARGRQSCWAVSASIVLHQTIKNAPGTVGGLWATHRLTLPVAECKVRYLLASFTVQMQQLLFKLCGHVAAAISVTGRSVHVRMLCHGAPCAHESQTAFCRLRAFPDRTYGPQATANTGIADGVWQLVLRCPARCTKYTGESQGLMRSQGHAYLHDTY
jgi:hypothetical protein